MKKNEDIARSLGVTPQRLQYWLNKPDAPDYIFRFERGRMVRYYDEEEVVKYWDEK